MREEHSEIPSPDGYTYTPLVCDDGSVTPAPMPCQQVSASSVQLTKSGSLEWFRLTFGRPSSRLYQLRGCGGTDTGRAQCNERNDMGMEVATSPEPRAPSPGVWCFRTCTISFRNCGGSSSPEPFGGTKTHHRMPPNAATARVA